MTLDTQSSRTTFLTREDAQSDLSTIKDDFMTLESNDRELWSRIKGQLMEELSGQKHVHERIDRLILPVAKQALEWRKRILDSQPLIVGFNAPQGAGKSTLTKSLVRILSEFGFNAITLSIDDFYLTRSQQEALAQRFSGNPYLQQRGYPGTHDVELGVETLRSLRTLTPGQKVKIPAYDKSAFSGLGDRYPKEAWPEVVGPVDLVFLEGWMLGFAPVEHPEGLSGEMLQINELLKSYSAWHSELNAFVQLVPLDPSFVISWRVEAEEVMKASGRGGMTREQVESYVMKFMPAYRTYGPRLKCPVSAQGGHLVFEIDLERRVVQKK